MKKNNNNTFSKTKKIEKTSIKYSNPADILNAPADAAEPVTNPSQRPPASKWTRIFAVIVSFLVGLGIVGGIACLFFAGSMLKGMPELDVDRLKAPDSTIIYDANGDVLVELGMYLRENIEYDEMPNVLIDAFLSIEDSRFFEHFGFDIPRFTKAIIANLQSGSFGQGGSTITMQLVKNSYFQIDANDQSTIADRDGLSGVKRKLQEIVLAIQSNYAVSKKETIAMFINKINFGNNIRGVEKAALYYFGKSARELNLVESAFLAGIINGPNSFNPYNELNKHNEAYIYLNPNVEYLQNAQRRTAEVLDLMAYHGYISQSECAIAKEIRIEDLIAGVDNRFSSYNEYYQSYIDAVIDEAIAITGKDPYLTSMRIHTAMNPEIQKYVFDMQDGQLQYTYTRDNEQSAIVVLNNQNGELIALGGGSDQSGTRQFNRATSAYIQPGSAIKPILEYVLAFDQLGWATSHTITDRPIYLYDSKILIRNAGNQDYTGDMLITEAIARSLNTPAIQTLEAVVKEKDEEFVVNYLNSIGISCSLEDFDLQWAIGGNRCLVTPVQLAAAHGMLINQGVYVKPHTICSIEFTDEETYTADTAGTQVVSPAAAYMTAYCEEYNVSGPFFNYMQILKSKYPVMAKTGTTDWGNSGRSYNIPTGAPKDSWLVAQTSNYTITIWLGFDKLEKGSYFRNSDISYNLKGRWGKLLLDKLDEVLDYGPGELEQPDDCVSIKHIKGAYPYAKADGSYPSVTGLIRSDHQQLINVSDIEKETVVGKLLGMQANRNDDGTITIIWNGFSGYSDGGGIMDISATNRFGDTTVATGRCYFPRYYYINPDRYYASVNGSYVESSSPMTTIGGIEGPLEVCGWTSSSGDTICTTIN